MKELLDGKNKQIKSEIIEQLEESMKEQINNSHNSALKDQNAKIADLYNNVNTILEFNKKPPKQDHGDIRLL